ncbi:P-loop containing nucleoside triphosphate hydrolase protein [Armillaria luteobubalina]|uniref:P-loop containing nucleoside triphosphate hydrolase protein n=1 Tax=Armillaria luteobubalina TaxID=153913 RepID=A0AA39NW81_9AGAR|nr:P-loop containing nucleoside triphosphate hydrolase protein [Armillaria luteobubalina]
MSTEIPASETPAQGNVSTPAARPRTLILRYDEYNTGVKGKTKSIHSKKPVLVIRRMINSRGHYDHTEIDIMSHRLREILAEINQDVLGFRLTGSPAAETNESPDEALITDLKTSLDYTLEYFQGTLIEFKQLIDDDKIAFEYLWALIPPNTYVYRRFELTEQDQILHALDCSIDYGRGGDPPKAQLICEIISDDGDSFGLTQVVCEIPHFQGAKKIQDLEVFPLVFHPEADALRERAVARGKKYAKITKPSFHETHGCVMVDAVAFREYEPNATYNLDVLTVLNRSSLTDEQYMICNPVVLGFSFGTKSWGGFALDRLENVVWTKEPFGSLVLDEKYKRLIHALVKQHRARGGQFDDIVRGKGKGLIGLLSGNPGCGKTLTAEAVAEVTQRPLYVVSAGELGTEPAYVDSMLTRVLDLAHRWDAVMLLDEAEVFLQERSTDNLVRNALVSIFLRQLEYYQGILILTTNLVGHCDRALESRIHFCVYYTDLTYDARLKIWKTMSDFDLERLARLQLNGRQIKNAMASAKSIALEDNMPLSVEHIDTVLEVLSDWDMARNRSDL